VSEPRKIVEVEIVTEDDAREAPDHVVEHVSARRIPGGAFVARSVRASGADPKAVRKTLRGLKLRMWLFIVGFAAIAGGCFYGANVTESVFFAAFLIVTGIGMLLCISLTYLLIRLVGRLSPTPG
jgi:hypothetical protein